MKIKELKKGDLFKFENEEEIYKVTRFSGNKKYVFFENEKEEKSIYRDDLEIQKIEK